MHDVIDYTVDFFFFLDILLNCRTAYYDEDYEMVLDPKQILRNYASSGSGSILSPSSRSICSFYPLATRAFRRPS